MNLRLRAAVCGLAFFSTLACSRAAWTIQTVDTGAGVGYAAALAVDTAGYPHISYFRPNSLAGFSNLYYATRTGSTWSTESIVDGITNGTQGTATSIAVTELGNPAVSFTRSSTFVKYTIRSAGSWTSPLDVSTAGGGFSSLVWQGTEAMPTPQVAYNDSAANSLKVASLSAGTFSSVPLDTAIAAGADCSMAQVGTYMGVAYIDGDKLGFWQSPNSGMNWAAYSSNAFSPFKDTKALFCALALAPTKHNTFNPEATSAHILYYDNTNGRYYYETNDTDTGSWATPELVFQSSLASISQSGCSITVDAAGVIHVAFLDYNTKRLGYAKRTAAGWSDAEFIDGANLGGADCTIRLNAGGQPAIGYAALAYNSMTFTHEVTGLKFAELTTSPVPTTPAPSVALTFTISGKARLATGKSSVTIKGTASASAMAIQWKVGKKPFKQVAVAGGAWKVKVKPLAPGKNKVEFRAVSVGGETTASKIIKITRGN